MSEVMEREEQLTPELEPQTEPEKSSLKQKWKNMPRKKRRRLIRWIIILAILAAAGLMLYKIFGGSGGKTETEIMTAEVQYGSITATVEGSGMTRLAAENCDFLVSIPMKGRISSLNASAAAAILLYEAVRQRR